ncbi:OLC1v1029309C1 [Oldenlandia corymbosa var. corymbosa]|uniref:OLC1v1029309C1 n=1 Tax=Oldenlandia corymbosa var. corymbosa TaxID=529605 RepID=A0AAV1CGK3_OLDCO|nr:OLC1v1029309C1 [Oldenlandia corymbosa var. corymbosa]
MSNEEDLSSGQLLRDIEEISQALYLQRGPTKALLSQSHLGSDTKAAIHDVSHKNKKSSIWRWNPIKTLTHLRSHHRFNCLFFLHVHSIEGLASNFNDLKLCVNWKRKDEVFRTQPVRVSQGIAEFEETLMHQCSVHVNRNGPQNSLKYEPKLFLLQASVVGAPTLDIGNHWVDLARLLPLTWEELEEEKRTAGKWTTSFKLKGKGKGAVLNVSFGFTIPGDGSFDASHFVKVSDIIGVSAHVCPPPDVAGISLSSALNRLSSISRKTSNEMHHVSSQSLDMDFLLEASAKRKSELAQSVTLLYQKLDEGKVSNLNESQNLVPLSAKSASLTETICGGSEDLEDIDFDVIEQGIELPTIDELKLEHSQSAQESVIQASDDAEIFSEDLASSNERWKPSSGNELDFDSIIKYAEEISYEEDGEGVKVPSGDEPQMVSYNFLATKSPDPNAFFNVSKIIEQENNVEPNLSHGAGRMVRSRSLDDVNELVANEFLDTFGHDDNAIDMSSDNSEPESPRERLLRQFEKECHMFGESVLDLDSVTEDMEGNGFSRTGSGRFACSDDFDLSMAIQEAEKEYNRVSQSLRSRRNAKMLENLETETLMQSWGLNEKLFQNSPQTISGGFGSPIYVAPEEPSELPPLGEGSGPIIQISGGGFLRSMSSSLFRGARNGAKLIMQVSNQVVLPAIMGSDVIDILRHWASGGAEHMFFEANEVMPLQDITGRTMQQISLENECSAEVLDRVNTCSFCMQKTDGDSVAVQNAHHLCLGSESEDLLSEYVSLENLVPLALANIEALSIEGLRIQSGLSYEEAPSRIMPHFIRNCNAKGEGFKLDEVVGPSGVTASQFSDFTNENFTGLMKLSISLDNYIRLDAQGVDYEGEVDGYTLKLLESHYAKFSNVDSEQLTTTGTGRGLFGNNFTLAFRLQLRDPFRDFEMVREPMLALIQVEKLSVSPHQEMANMSTETDFGHNQSNLGEAACFQENDEKMISQVTPLFKISEVHVAGINIVSAGRQVLITGKQNHSGARWFLSSGINRISKRPPSLSNAIVKPSSQFLGKPAGEILWSISSHVQKATKWKELAKLNIHVRNPDIFLPSGSVWSSKA